MTGKILELKDELLINTSEELFQLLEPIPFMCDNFEKVRDCIMAVSTFCDSALGNKGEEVEYYIDTINDIEWETNGILEEVNSLNQAVEELRAWGQEWKDFAKRLIEENDIDIQKYI